MEGLAVDLEVRRKFREPLNRYALRFRQDRIVGDDIGKGDGRTVLCEGGLDRAVLSTPPQKNAQDQMRVENTTRTGAWDDEIAGCIRTSLKESGQHCLCGWSSRTGDGFCRPKVVRDGPTPAVNVDSDIFPVVVRLDLRADVPLKYLVAQTGSLFARPAWGHGDFPTLGGHRSLCVPLLGVLLDMEHSNNYGSVRQEKKIRTGEDGRSSCFRQGYGAPLFASPYPYIPL